jgi:simple sugar transport system permease protein
VSIRWRRAIGSPSNASAARDLIYVLMVVAAALLIALAFVVASGVSPGQAIAAFVQGAFGTTLNMTGTISNLVPIVLVALGWIVAARAGCIHIGFPGQIIVGGIFSSIVALQVSAPPSVHLPLTVAAGIVGGALYAAVAAVLWTWRGVNAILSTLLLNLVAVQLLAWWVREPFHDASTPLPQTAPFPETARWSVLIDRTVLYWDILLVPVVLLAIGFLLAKTTFGYRMRVVGANPSLARQAGMSAQRVGAGSIILSGALAGLAGTSLVLAANTVAMTDTFEAGYGFTGIAVALLARNAVVGVVPAALLFAALEQGGGSMEGTVGVPASLVDLVQGLVIVLVLVGTTIQRSRSKARMPDGSAPASPAETELSHSDTVDVAR